jgi:hypothetical protein
MAVSEQVHAYRTLSPKQLAAIKTVMQTFIADDLDRGVSPATRLYCHGCRGPRPQPGFLMYERYQLCNDCATGYETLLTSGQVATPGQFVRDRRFGEEFQWQLDQVAEA